MVRQKVYLRVIHGIEANAEDEDEQEEENKLNVCRNGMKADSKTDRNVADMKSGKAEKLSKLNY